MKNFIFLLFSFSLFSCNERYQTIAFSDTPITEKDMQKTAKFGMVEQVLTNHIYHQATEVESDDNTRCTFDLYRPRKMKGKKVPLVLVLHEGAFLTGDKSDFLSETMSKDLCRSGGFAVANCNYRLLRSPRVIFDKSFTRQKVNEAISDIRLAVRHFKENNELYLIDTTQIYVCGWSAGAIIANHLLFSDLDESLDYNSKKRRINFNNMEAYETDLGLAGVISIGGCLLNNSVDDDDLAKTKVLLIHGEKDDIVPLGFGPPLQRYRTAQTIDLGGISLGIEDKKGNEYKTKTTFKIPDWFMRKTVDLLTTEVYGSQAIFEQSPNQNMTLLEVKNGTHSFFITNGSFNKTYLDMRKKIIQFINHN
jgi:predicted esterase